jgi:hypothetical protein
MTNDGKFWGPVCDGERIVAWTRVDAPVPGAVEAMYDGVPMRFLRFRHGMIARLSDAERQEILDAEAAEAAQREADAQAALVAAEEARAQSQADYEARRAAEFVAMAPMVETYRDTLRKHFGPNAETNREVTETAVAAYFEAKRIPETINAVETADAIALTRYFTILAAWNGTGETWTLPYHLVEGA